MGKKYILTIFFMALIVGMTIFVVNDNTRDEKIKNESILIKNKKDTTNNDNNEDKKQSESREIKLIKTNKRSYQNNNSANNTKVSSNIKKIIVYFNYNGGTKEIESKEVIYKQEYGYLPTPKKEGYTFEGWYIDKDFNKKIETTTIDTIKENHTLYAKYNINKYLITYDFNYLENNLYKKLMDKSSWNNDFEVLITDEIFFNENVFKFKPNLNNTSIRYKEKIKLEEDRIYTFSVYVKANVEKNLLIGLNGELINIKTNSSWQRFTRTFNSKKNNYEDFVFSLDNSEIWDNDDILEIYGLMLSEGDLNKKEEIKYYNEKLGKLDNPVRNGYIFDGWYTDYTFKEKINPNIIVNSDKNYYAKWSPNIYTLEINPNKGTYSGDKGNVVFAGGFETIKKLDKPKANYKITYDLNNSGAVNNKNEDIVDRPFKGFVDNKNNLYDSDIYVFNKDSKLIANYEENVNVTLDSIIRNDYTCFWNTKSDGSGKKYDSSSNISINSDITLYASCKLNDKFIRPIKLGCITSEYGNRIHPIYNTKKFHSGLDMAGSDKNIYPVLNGKIAKTGYNSSMGNYIIIHHTMNGKNYTSAYYHLEIKYVKKGDLVTENTIIGMMGQTGAATGVHLHLTMYEGHLYNESTKMINPRDYINFPSKIYSYWQDRVE